MCNDSVIGYIETRRSVRRYTDEPVTRETLEALVEAARWAPSGLNNQPWRFITIESREVLDNLAALTKYSRILKSAPAAIAVFIDTSRIYHREKDIQSIGAAIENLLLAAHSYGLGACWLGEILNRHEEVENLLEAPIQLELMAVIALGYPLDDEPPAAKNRYPLDEIIVKHL